MLLRKDEEEVHNEAEGLKACNDGGPTCGESECGWITWIAVKLMRP